MFKSSLLSGNKFLKQTWTTITILDRIWALQLKLLQNFRIFTSLRGPGKCRGPLHHFISSHGHGHGLSSQMPSNFYVIILDNLGNIHLRAYLKPCCGSAWMALCHICSKITAVVICENFNNWITPDFDFEGNILLAGCNTLYEKSVMLAYFSDKL